MNGGGIDADSGRRRPTGEGRRGATDDYAIATLRGTGLFPATVVAVVEEFSTLYAAADFAATNDVDVLDGSSADRLLAVDGVGHKVRETIASLSLLPGGSQPEDVNRETWDVECSSDAGQYILRHRDGTRIDVFDVGECWRTTVDRVDDEYTGVLCEGPQSRAVEAARTAARRYPLITNPRTLEPDTLGWMPADPANNQRRFYHD